ncbi:hypothetical protein [Caldiplasma sukawensis]
MITVLKDIMIQSMGRSLSIYFFSDEEVEKIFKEIAGMIKMKRE